MRASISCTVLVRFDGEDPLADTPDSIESFRQEYAAGWDHLYACLAAVGVQPLSGPPPNWWKVEGVFTFAPHDVGRVADLLAAAEFRLEVCSA
jgi:hypothetical protein